MQRIYLLLIALIVWGSVQAQFKVAGIFGDYAVVQQGISVPVWGNTNAGALVKVSIAGVESKTIADSAGNWILHLGPLKAEANRYELIIKCNAEEIIYRNTHDFGFTNRDDYNLRGIPSDK